MTITRGKNIAKIQTATYLHIWKKSKNSWQCWLSV